MAAKIDQLMQRVPLVEIAESVAMGLASVLSDAAGTFIRTPLAYSSGAAVTVRLDYYGDAYFVSDYGLGRLEAEMAGAVHQFSRVAPLMARRSGISFDQNAFFVTRVSRDQLVGATGAVANCSKEAVDLAVLRLSERRYSDKDIQFFERLQSIFGSRFHAGQHLHGESADWTVDALIESDNNQAVFEFVRPRPQSVYPVVVKFHDLARTPRPPKLYAVGRQLKPELEGLLTQAGNVLSPDVSDDILRRAA